MREDEPQYNTGEPEQFRKLFIGGLNYKTSDEGLRDFYSQWGDLTDSVVMKDGQSGKSRGFGFVTFRNCDMVDEAMRNRPHEIDGRQVQPKRAVPREDTTSPGSNLSVKKVYIAGLKDKPIEKEDIEEYFKTFGNVIDCQVLMDEETGKNKGFAFVTFDDFDSVDKVVLQKYHMIYNFHLNVKKAFPKDIRGQKSTCKGPRGGGPSRGNFGPGGGGNLGPGRGRGNNFQSNGGNHGNSRNSLGNHYDDSFGGGDQNDSDRSGQNRNSFGGSSGQGQEGGQFSHANSRNGPVKREGGERDGPDMHGGNGGDWHGPFGGNHQANEGIRSSDDFGRLRDGFESGGNGFRSDGNEAKSEGFHERNGKGYSRSRSPDGDDSKPNTS